MVGDDVRTDVRAAQRAGLRGILVLSGKHGAADVEAAARERGGRRPDAIAPTSPRWSRRSTDGRSTMLGATFTRRPV